MANSKAAKPDEAHVSGQSNKPLSHPAHALSFDQVAEELRANTLNGLSTADAKSRLEEFGHNDLGEAEGVQPLKIIIAQIANAMTMVKSTPTSRLFHRLTQITGPHLGHGC